MRVAAVRAGLKGEGGEGTGGRGSAASETGTGCDEHGRDRAATSVVVAAVDGGGGADCSKRVIATVGSVGGRKGFQLRYTQTYKHLR